MELFMLYLRVAAVSLGVLLPPVEVARHGEFWAQVCNSCEPRIIRLSDELIRYRDKDFTRLVAYHEVCHLKLGHDATWVLTNGKIKAEEEANQCMRDTLGITMAEVDLLNSLAQRWLDGR